MTGAGRSDNATITHAPRDGDLHFLLARRRAATAACDARKRAATAALSTRREEPQDATRPRYLAGSFAHVTRLINSPVTVTRGALGQSDKLDIDVTPDDRIFDADGQFSLRIRTARDDATTPEHGKESVTKKRIDVWKTKTGSRGDSSLIRLDDLAIRSVDLFEPLFRVCLLNRIAELVWVILRRELPKGPFGIIRRRIARNVQDCVRIHVSTQHEQYNAHATICSKSVLTSQTLLQECLSRFPYAAPRIEQTRAIEFALDAIVSQKKRFCILDLGVGAGKSGVAIALARYLPNVLSQRGQGFSPGAYITTTQKTLQDQYLRDFGSAGDVRQIKSSSNYGCVFHRNQTCGESKRLLKSAPKWGAFFETCASAEKCPYKADKQRFVDSPVGVTNVAYFLAETFYSGELEPRELLVIDEAHSIERSLSSFVEVSFSEWFSSKELKLKMPKDMTTQLRAIQWISETYAPKVSTKLSGLKSSAIKKLRHVDETVGAEEKKIASRIETLDKHLCKVNRFLGLYDPDNWAMWIDGAGETRRVTFKPIDVAPHAEEIMFRCGRSIVMLSATVMDPDEFFATLGIERDDAAYLRIASPFPPENRPFVYAPIGKMTYGNIDATLPTLAKAVQAIMEHHENEKGIIHTTNYKIARFIADQIASDRIVSHGPDDRDVALRRHFESRRPTVLVSPSMTEGIDLADDLSRWQIIAKVPYPSLSDPLVRKRMRRRERWYAYETAKTIVQAMGRSIRSADDRAVTYVLDSDWERFYAKHASLFPDDVRTAIERDAKIS